MKIVFNCTNKCGITLIEKIIKKLNITVTKNNVDNHLLTLYLSSKNSTIGFNMYDKIIATMKGVKIVPIKITMQNKIITNTNREINGFNKYILFCFINYKSNLNE